MIQKKPLEERISDIRAECAAYVKKHVKDQKAGGVPAVVLERMVYARVGGDPCQAALDCIATEKRDLEIARKQAS